MSPFIQPAKDPSSIQFPGSKTDANQLDAVSVLRIIAKHLLTDQNQIHLSSAILALAAKSASHAIESDRTVREALAGAVLFQLGRGNDIAAIEIFKILRPVGTERASLIQNALEEELKRPTLGAAASFMAQCCRIGDNIQEPYNRELNRRIASGNLERAAVELEIDRKTLLRSEVALSAITVYPENEEKFKEQLITLLDHRSWYPILELVDIGELKKDPQVRAAAISSLAKCLGSENWNKYRVLDSQFQFSVEELRGKDVSSKSLILLKDFARDFDHTAIAEIRTRLKPEAIKAEGAIVQGLLEAFKLSNYSAEVALEALKIVKSSRLSETTLLSADCQKLGIHCLVAFQCYACAPNHERVLPHSFEAQVMATFPLTSDNLEEAALTSAGRIYGGLSISADECEGNINLGDSVLLDRSDGGKLRFFPPYLKRIIELYDIRTFGELRAFSGQNSPLITPLARSGDGELVQTSADIAAGRTLHLSPFLIEKLANESVNLSSFAERRDFLGLWDEVKKLSQIWINLSDFEAFADTFGYERAFELLEARQRTHPYEGINQARDFIELLKVSNLDADEFFNRIIALVIKPKAASDEVDPLNQLFKLESIIQSSRGLSETLQQYPERGPSPNYRQAFDRLVTEYPDRDSIFSSLRELFSFTDRLEWLGFSEGVVKHHDKISVTQDNATERFQKMAFDAAQLAKDGKFKFPPPIVIAALQDPEIVSKAVIAATMELSQVRGRAGERAQMATVEFLEALESLMDPVFNPFVKGILPCDMFGKALEFSIGERDFHGYQWGGTRENGYYVRERLPGGRAGAFFGVAYKEADSEEYGDPDGMATSIRLRNPHNSEECRITVPGRAILTADFTKAAEGDVQFLVTDDVFNAVSGLEDFFNSTQLEDRIRIPLSADSPEETLNLSFLAASSNAAEGILPERSSSKEDRAALKYRQDLAKRHITTAHSIVGIKFLLRGAVDAGLRGAISNGAFDTARVRILNALERIDNLQNFTEREQSELLRIDAARSLYLRALDLLPPFLGNIDVDFPARSVLDDWGTLQFGGNASTLRIRFAQELGTGTVDSASLTFVGKNPLISYCTVPDAITGMPTTELVVTKEFRASINEFLSGLLRDSRDSRLVDKITRMLVVKPSDNSKVLISRGEIQS